MYFAQFVMATPLFQFSKIQFVICTAKGFVSPQRWKSHFRGDGRVFGEGLKTDFSIASSTSNCATFCVAPRHFSRGAANKTKFLQKKRYQKQVNNSNILRTCAIYPVLNGVVEVMRHETRGA
jgi:hypothetical protein